MTLKKDLFLATLSLDAYNQGYDSNFIHGETTIGSAVFNLDEKSIEAQAASFYAVAYDVPGAALVSQGNSPGDSIVISYRGTDSPLNDVWTGWITATGVLGEQARLAAASVWWAPTIGACKAQTLHSPQIRAWNNTAACL